MSDLDLGFYFWGSHSMLDNYIEPTHERFAVPVATFLKGGATVLNTSAEHSYPFAYIKPAIEEILKSNGYNLPNGTLETNLTDDDWNTKAVNICSMSVSDDCVVGLQSIYRATESFAASFYEPFVEQISSTFSMIPYIDGSEEGIEWEAIVDCTATFSLSQSTSDTALGNSWLNIYNHTTSEVFIHSYIHGNYSYSEAKQVRKGDIIRFYVFKNPSTAGKSFAFDASIVNLVITDPTNQTVPIGGKLHLSKNLGFESQFDFFKAFVQSFGLTVRVDEATKTVSAYTMEKLYNNKSKRLDWSKKLNDIEKNTVFSIGSYGQTNTVKFNDNTDDVVTDSGSFTVSNKSLPLTKELFSIAFEAGKESVNYYTANIPIEEKAEDGTITFKGGKPHLVDIGLNPVTHDSWNARHVKAQSLIDTYYTKLVQMLTNAKMLTDVELWLTDQDIEDLDQFTPVWIEKYGCFFYVNKVKNYISGKLTKCDLIKL